VSTQSQLQLVLSPPWLAIETSIYSPMEWFSTAHMHNCTWFAHLLLRLGLASQR
jgi:hypothetical protein